MDDLVEAASRNEPGFPEATAPVSPLAPEVSPDEFKYIAAARQEYLDTGRPPRGFGVRVYGDHVIVRRLSTARTRA
jgi:hypothetical protein